MSTTEPKRFFLKADTILNSDLLLDPIAYVVLDVLIAMANGSDEPFTKQVNGSDVTLNKGEVCVSLRFLAKKLHITKSAVESVFKRLVKRGSIERVLVDTKVDTKLDSEPDTKLDTKSKRVPDTYRICNFKKYQAFETYGEKHSTPQNHEYPTRNSTQKSTQNSTQKSTNSSIFNQTSINQSLESDGRANSEMNLTDQLANIGDDLMGRSSPQAWRDQVETCEASAKIDPADQRPPDWCWGVADMVKQATKGLMGRILTGQQVGFVAKDVHSLTYSPELTVHPGEADILAVLKWASKDSFWRTKINVVTRPGNFSQCWIKMREEASKHKGDVIPINRKALLLDEDDSDLKGYVPEIDNERQAG